MSLHERAVRFGAHGTLIGIVTPPPAGVTPHTAFAFLNAGVVHRVGPNRMHVTAARRLAARGFLCVRFDLSGLGDSSSRRDATPVDHAVVLETTEVLSTLQREYGVGRFVLAGLCSGAVGVAVGGMGELRGGPGACASPLARQAPEPAQLEAGADRQERLPQDRRSPAAADRVGSPPRSRGEPHRGWTRGRLPAPRRAGCAVPARVFGRGLWNGLSDRDSRGSSVSTR